MTNRRHRTDSPYSWLVAFCSMFLWFVSAVAVIGNGVFYVEFIERFNAGEVTVSWIPALLLIVDGLFGPVSSAVIDLFGFRVSSFIGVALCAVGAFICSVTDHIAFVFLGFGVFKGAAVSFLVMTSILSTQTYFTKWRSVGMSIAALGGSLGFAIVPVFLRYLLDTYGYRGSLLVLTAFYLQGLPFGFVIRSATVTSKTNADSMVADADKKGVDVFCNTIRAFFKNLLDMTLFKDFRVCFYFLGLLGCAMYHSCTMAFTIARGISHGESKQEASVTLSVFGWANLVGRLFFAWVGDKTSRLAVLSGVVVFTAVGGILTCIISYNRILFLVCYTAIGLSFGGYVVLLYTAMVDIVGLAKLSKASGYSCMLYGIAGFIGLPLSGWIVEITRSYDLLVLVNSCVLLCAGIIFIVLTVLNFRQRRRERKQGESEQKKEAVLNDL